MRKLGRVQQDVYAALKLHGSWSLGCGWLWDTYSGTQRVMDSLVRAGYATSTEGQGGSRIFYRPINPLPTRPAVLPINPPPTQPAVLLSGGHAVDGDDVSGMLKRQHALLLKLGKDLTKSGHDENSAVQRAITDAKLLGLEVAERWEEASLAAHKNLP
jgi:hypothetical protein